MAAKPKMPRQQKMEAKGRLLWSMAKSGSLDWVETGIMLPITFCDLLALGEKGLLVSAMDFEPDCTLRIKGLCGFAFSGNDQTKRRPGDVKSHPHKHAVATPPVR
jgi:hypothetical protein